MRITKAISNEAGQESGDALSRPKAPTLIHVGEKSMQKNSNTARANLGPPFSLGEIFITPRAEEALEIAGETAIQFLRRHMSGDWGEVSPEDAQENDLSLQEGFRLLSAYTTVKGQKIWIITEADRNSTTILLPAEY